MLFPTAIITLELLIPMLKITCFSSSIVFIYIPQRSIHVAYYDMFRYATFSHIYKLALPDFRFIYCEFNGVFKPVMKINN